MDFAGAQGRQAVQELRVVREAVERRLPAGVPALEAGAVAHVEIVDNLVQGGAAPAGGSIAVTTGSLDATLVLTAAAPKSVANIEATMAEAVR